MILSRYVGLNIQTLSTAGLRRSWYEITAGVKIRPGKIFNFVQKGQPRSQGEGLSSSPALVGARKRDPGNEVAKRVVGHGVSFGGEVHWSFYY